MQLDIDRQKLEIHAYKFKKNQQYKKIKTMFKKVKFFFRGGKFYFDDIEKDVLIKCNNIETLDQIVNSSVDAIKKAEGNGYKADVKIKEIGVDKK